MFKIVNNALEAIANLIREARSEGAPWAVMARLSTSFESAATAGTLLAEDDEDRHDVEEWRHLVAKHLVDFPDLATRVRGG